MALKLNRKAASKPTQLFFAEHNVVAYFEKSDKSKLFDEMNDFLEKSNTHFALTMNPVICKQRIAEFWDSAKKSVDSNGVGKIDSRVNGNEISLTEEMIRKHLKFNDAGGDPDYKSELYLKTYEAIGYGGDLTCGTIKKGQLPYVWRYLAHTILHCLSHKKTAWDELAAPQSSAFHGLVNGLNFNFSKMIFDGMLENLKPKRIFYMYPRFIQHILNCEFPNLQISDQHLELKSFTSKTFSNMQVNKTVFLGKDTSHPIPKARTAPEQTAPGDNIVTPTSVEPTPDRPSSSTDIQIPTKRKRMSTSKTTPKNTKQTQQSPKRKRTRSPLPRPSTGLPQNEGGISPRPH